MLNIARESYAEWKYISIFALTSRKSGKILIYNNSILMFDL